VVVLAVVVAIIFVTCRKRKSPASGGIPLQPASGGVPLQPAPTAVRDASIYDDPSSVRAQAQASEYDDVASVAKSHYDAPDSTLQF
jgi:hypothetical protein